jgi:hypothetical protein
VKGALEYVLGDVIMVFEHGHLMGKDYSRTAGFVVSFLLGMEEGSFFGRTLVSGVMNM